MAEIEHARAIIESIGQRLLAEYAPSKVILCGSYAHGRPDPDSDVDLLIIKETNQGFIDRWVIRRINALAHFMQISGFDTINSINCCVNCPR